MSTPKKHLLKEGDKVFSIQGGRVQKAKGVVPTGTLIRFTTYNGYPAAIVEKDNTKNLKAKRRVFLEKNLRKLEVVKKKPGMKKLVKKK